ncbi:hypothetical protein [Dictyobacter aurantiacus]|uniref:Uncharacterized protein n=1 Tax=Dictyobacter aurantiacus TaxID=1936993 RepID=A0A401ZKM0_9CHLR|nr:hypothetical protein [Dictyobacter aurantiacus]GCE07396.1 hypothetical protein KDAU_47250 [Dictyobacter aurantiacus]
MEPEDFVEPEIAVTAAVVAVIFSPRARKLIRQGLVYGTAGVLMAGDAINSFARSVGRSFEQTQRGAGAHPATAAKGSGG